MESEKKLNEFSIDSMRRIAQQIVIRKYVVILHGWIYIFANLLLFVLNRVINFNYPWFLWPLTGWGVAFLIHAFTYWVFKKGIVHIAKLIFYYHLWIYILLNLLVIFIDCFTSTPRWNPSGWFLWVLGSWTVLLILHLVIILYILPHRGESADKTWLERKIEKELEKIKKGMIPTDNKKQLTESDKNNNFSNGEKE